MNFYDTIAALSSPSGKGGVAVIRISGAEAFDVAQKVFFAASGKPFEQIKPNVMTYGSIASCGRVIDDGLCVKFAAPRSFTGEDTVELNCHGGILITQKVLSAVFAAGARPAQAGEFTRRAFVNGKMGLTQAEALGTLLDAKSDGQISLARSVMGGRLTEACKQIYSDLTALVASVYAVVDYPEEDLADMTSAEMIESACGVISRVDALLSTYKTGHAVMEGVKTVIIGKPNVGKSSLYNRLVGYDAAIVTDIEGTTRDLLTETVSLGRVTLRLCDTAGLRDSADTVERIGVDRARSSIKEAELILAVFDGSRPLDGDDLEIIKDILGERATKIAVINKNDEQQMISEQEIEKYFSHTVKISARNEYNIDVLRSIIEELYINEDIDTASDPILINARQNAALERTREHLLLAVEALRSGLSPDLAGVDVELAMSAVAELDGREVGEDVVAQIFSHFCVGK